MDSYKHATSTEIQISEINVVFFFFFLNSLLQDEDVYTFFEPELPCESLALARTRSLDPARTSISMIPDSKNQAKAHQYNAHCQLWKGAVIEVLLGGL